MAAHARPPAHARALVRGHLARFNGLALASRPSPSRNRKIAITDYLIRRADGLYWEGPAAAWCDGHSGGGHVGLPLDILRALAGVRLTDWREPGTAFSSPDVGDWVRICLRMDVPVESAERRLSALCLEWAMDLYE